MRSGAMGDLNNSTVIRGRSNTSAQFGQVQDSNIYIGESARSDATKFLRSLASDYRRWKDTNPKRVTRTCEWLLEDPRFLSWRDAKLSALLHVLAGPGCGKSVLARALIDESLACSSVEDEIILYFFFKRGEKVQEKATTAVAAMLHQFYGQTADAGLEKHALPKYKSIGEALRHMFSDLWDILISTASDAGGKTVVCVLDALDECEQADREQLMASISEHIAQSISEPRRTPIKFLVTSRPYPDTEFNDLGLLDHHSFVRFDGSDKSEAIAEEINRVIAAKVPATIPKFPAAKQQAIVDHLQSMQNRTYLWLHLILSYIKKNIVLHGTEQRLRALIDRLPPTIEEAYEEMLSKSPDNALTKTLLSIILAANRTLTLDEANMAFELAQSHYHNLQEIDLCSPEQFKDVLSELSGLLLTVHDGKVYFLHETAREFLLKDATISESSTTWKGSIDLVRAHGLLASVCTSFLSLTDFNSMAPWLPEHEDDDFLNWWCDPALNMEEIEQFNDWVKEYRFFPYAAINWMSHYGTDESNNFQHLRSNAWELCEEKSIIYKNWTSVYLADKRSYRMYLYLQKDLPFFSKVGLLMVVKELIQTGSLINKSGQDGETALDRAADKGNEQLVRMLLEEGADADSKDLGGQTALYQAALRGYDNIVRAIIEGGGDIEMRNGRGETALIGAAMHGQEKIVDILLEHGAKVNSRDRSGRNALFWAVEKSEVQIAKVLLEHGAHVHGRDRRSRRSEGMGESTHMLYYPTERGEEELVRLLLQYGVDVNTRVFKYPGDTALHCAATAGQTAIVKILCENGADTELRNDHHQTPAISASTVGMGEALQTLLEHGADIHATTKNGWTCLHKAAWHGHQQVAAVLIAHRVDMNALNSDGETAYMVALKRDRSDVLSELADDTDL